MLIRKKIQLNFLVIDFYARNLKFESQARWLSEAAKNWGLHSVAHRLRWGPWCKMLLVSVCSRQVVLTGDKENDYNA